MGYDITVLGADTRRLAGWREILHFNSSVYLRLLIPDMINEEKVIYLDSDLIVLGDLSELYSTLTDEFYLAGAVDRASETSRIPRAENDIYINSGVLVMNLRALRQAEFFNKSADLYSLYSELLVWPDQCLINKFAETKKLAIDPRWNRRIESHAVTMEDWSKYSSRDASSVIHFVGSIKPWHIMSLPYVADFWRRYANDLKIKMANVVSGHQKVSRNSPCPCGSGKRFKHCHGAIFP